MADLRKKLHKLALKNHTRRPYDKEMLAERQKSFTNAKIKRMKKIQSIVIGETKFLFFINKNFAIWNVSIVGTPSTELNNTLRGQQFQYNKIKEFLTNTFKTKE